VWVTLRVSTGFQNKLRCSAHLFLLQNFLNSFGPKANNTTVDVAPKNM